MSDYTGTVLADSFNWVLLRNYSQVHPTKVQSYSPATMDPRITPVGVCKLTVSGIVCYNHVALIDYPPFISKIYPSPNFKIPS